MTTRVVHRPARTVRPVGAEEPLTIAAPPALPEHRTASGVQGLIPLAGAGVAMSMMMFLRGSGFAALGAVILLVSLGAAGVFQLTQRGQATRRRKAQRERYLDYLDRLREDLLRHERAVRDRSARADPPVSHLLDIVRDPARRWERRRADADFLRVRIGTGTLPLRDLRMREEDGVTNPADPFMKAEAAAVIRRFGRTPGLPLRVGLDRAGDVSVIGPRWADVLTVARAILAQVGAFHALDDVAVVVLAPPEREPDWAWTRWLPHLLDRARIGPAGPAPRLVTDPESLAALLADELAERAGAAARSYRHGGGAEEARTRSRLLVIDDAYGGVARTLTLPDPAAALPELGVTVVHLLARQLDEPGEVCRRITVGGAELLLEDLTASPPLSVHGTVDDACAPLVEGLARQLAPLRLSPDCYDDGTGTPPADFTGLLGITDPTALALDRLWRPRSERDFLRVPLGVDAAGRPTLLDLKEAAQLGMGPHGLCVGATGSGKSELLRTLVLALAVTHPPEQLSLLLVDYKGGATFAPFTPLPHVAGLITNLAADTSLVERMYTSLDGEVLRRQQLLADAGKLTDIAEYQLRRSSPAGADLPPLGHLLVVIDEFGELITAKPEFVELFLRIGRIGRSIGVHLLLASQRVEQGRMRGLETYLSYRIGLRTLSEAESRTVLDTADAFHLPSLPGNGYLKVDVTVYEKFKAAYVSGPVPDGTEPESAPVAGPLVKPMPRFARPAAAAEPAAEPLRATPRTTGPTLLCTVVDQIADAGQRRRVPPIWLPPLPPAITLDQAGGGFDVTPEGVRLRVAQRSRPGLHVPVGVLDDPARQWQGPWLVDLSGSGGNLLVLGGPGSGKTTALRTLALGLATTHSPTEVGLYGIDLLGSGLRGLAGLPHVGGVASRDDRERVRRTVDEVHGMLAEREALFTRHHLDTVADLRAERAAGRVPELACTEVVLLIDGYGRLVAEFESLEGRVHDILARGGRYGVHVVATARRWNEVRAPQQVAFANRVELRMTEPGESSIDGRLARGVPADVPGRALTTGKLYGQVALPRLDSVPDPAGSALAEAATVVRGAWTGPLPPPVRVLPPVLRAADLADVPAAPGTVPIGRCESDFAPAVLDLFGRDQNLLVLGDSGTGKTNLLRLVARSLVRQYSPDELVFAVFDPRHGLRDAVPEEYCGGYAPNAVLAARLAASVCQELAARQASGGRQATPRIVLLIDDYDVLAASATQPLGAFVPYLAAGRDIGLHVVLTRRVSGASRGLYEPFPLGVRESGCLGLLLSGDRTEGQLLGGVRPRPLPVGRAQYVRAGERARTVQTALLDPTGQAAR